MRALWLVNQLWVIVPINPRKNRASSELLYKSNRPQVSMIYICKPLACGSWFTNSSRVLPTSRVVYQLLVYTTQVNSTFRVRWLASSEVISQVLFTSEQPKRNNVVFVGILPQIKLLFGPLVIQFVWYILKQLFTSVSVKVVDIYLHYGE